MEKFSWSHLAIKLTSRAFWLSLAGFAGSMVTLFTDDSMGVQVTSGITAVAFVGLFMFDQYNSGKTNGSTVSDTEFFSALQTIITSLAKLKK